MYTVMGNIICLLELLICELHISVGERGHNDNAFLSLNEPPRQLILFWKTLCQTDAVCQTDASAADKKLEDRASSLKQQEKVSRSTSFAEVASQGYD